MNITVGASNRASRTLNGALKLSSGLTVRHKGVDPFAVRHDTTLDDDDDDPLRRRPSTLAINSPSSPGVATPGARRSVRTVRPTPRETRGRRAGYSRGGGSRRTGGGHARDPREGTAAPPASPVSASPAVSAASAGASTSRTATRTRRYPANAGGNASSEPESASYTRSANDSDPRSSDASSIAIDAAAGASSGSALLVVSPARLSHLRTRERHDEPGAPSRHRTHDVLVHDELVRRSGPRVARDDARASTPPRRGMVPWVETNSVPSGRAYATVMDAVGGSSAPSSAPSGAPSVAPSVAGSSTAASAVSAGGSSCAGGRGDWG